MPEDATWDDLMQRIYFHQTIEAGLKDSDAGHAIAGDLSGHGPIPA